MKEPDGITDILIKKFRNTVDRVETEIEDLRYERLDEWAIQNGLTEEQFDWLQEHYG